jgi:hypothetical protein
MRLQKQSGAAIVEFALVLPLLLVLSILVAEFGRALYQYDTLAKAVRAGARHLSMYAPNTQVAQARNLVIYGNVAGTGSPVVPGLGAAHVPNPTWQDAGTLPVINTVTISVVGFTFQPMFTSAFGITLPAMTFPSITATMRALP